MGIVYAELSMADYDAAMDLWRASEGIGLSASDSPEGIAAFLARSPGMSFTAREDGLLVGAVLGGHDGRRGYLHHLAVRSDRRGRGIGSELARHCLDALGAAGIDKCHLFIFRDNTAGLAFWRKTGWTERVDLSLMSKLIP